LLSSRSGLLLHCLHLEIVYILEIKLLLTLFFFVNSSFTLALFEAAFRNKLSVVGGAYLSHLDLTRTSEALKQHRLQWCSYFQTHPSF